MGLRIITILAFGVLAASAFSGSDDKFIKKYAMMKIYESCFGQEVIRQIREEMKLAVAKCAAMELEPVTPAERLVTTPAPTQPPTTAAFNPPSFPNAIPISSQPLQDTKGFLPEPDTQSNSIKAGFDPEKLHQAILAYRPNPFQPNMRPYNAPATSYFPAYANPGYAAPGPFYPGASPYSAAYPQFAPFFHPGQYFPGQRLSRELDLNNHVEALKSRLNGKVRNVTCVMQELGYLDSSMEPTYDKIIQKINNLDIQEDLKHDIEEGIDFCKQFSQCIPESSNERSPFSSALMKPMFFFRCYKHKKLEACIMKDVRDRYNSATEEPLDGGVEQELFRRAKSAKIDSKEKETSSEELTSNIFDFLYGNESVDLDGIF